MTDWIGKKLGRVHIESLLARGGMAEVYLGTHTTLQRKVAVKILRHYLTDDPRLRPHERFELEARAVAKLRHPNIVQVFDFDTIDDQPYLVMEFIPGPPLSKYLAALHGKGGQIGFPLISRLLTKIAGALQYAHESGVIHRDVKPGNILLTSRSLEILPGETLPLDIEPVLTDFGLVRFLNASRQTASGLITGTPAYMSPEQAMGESTDGRTDVYSLGIVLYEMLSGKVPFDAESTMSILLKHINDVPPPIPGLSPALQRVLDRALAKQVDARFTTPNEFAAAFNTALEQSEHSTTLATIPQVLEVAKENRTAKARRRTNWLPTVLVALLLVFAGAAFLWSRNLSASNVEPPTPPPPTVSDTPILGIPVTFGPTSNLQFEDGNAILDRVRLIAQAMPAPPANKQYSVWLVNGEQRLLIGSLVLDASGKGELVFEEPQGQNLLAQYHQVEITLGPDGEPTASTEIAYAYALPDAGVSYLSGLMVSFPATPGQIGLIHGMTNTARLLEQTGEDMLNDLQTGNEAGIRQGAESILNLLAGTQSADHKDWDGDGQITDPGDGYGFFLNGNNLGYLQAVYSYTDYAINSPGASQNMIVNGGNVKSCSENLAGWVPELRDQVTAILNTGTLSEMSQGVERSAELADRILNGVDRDESGEVEPISDECGVLAAHEAVYHMADMPLLPVTASPLETALAVIETSTPTLTGSPTSFFGITSTRRPGDNSQPATVAPTRSITTNEPPTNQPPTSQPPISQPPTNQPPTSQPPTRVPPTDVVEPPTDEPNPTCVNPQGHPIPCKSNP